MIKLRQVVVVEGKYDKITLSNIIDATIITTDGFGIYKNKDKMALIRAFAKNKGIIIDADGLNIISRLISEKVSEEEGVEGRIRYLAELLPAGTILTPHKKELSTLNGIPLADLVGCIIDSSAPCTYNNELIYVKKDVRTIVSFGNSDYINISGNDGMATAGSGDVLAGMIAGLLAQGESPKMAAMAGCFLHGMAGDVAARNKGPRSMLASDILEAIPEVLTEA